MALPAKHPVYVEGIGQNDRERDNRPPENKLQGLRGRRRLPKCQATDHDVGVNAVREAYRCHQTDNDQGHKDKPAVSCAKNVRPGAASKPCPEWPGRNSWELGVVLLHQAV